MRTSRDWATRVSFFFQAEDGIRDSKVTGVQTCALPICGARAVGDRGRQVQDVEDALDRRGRLLDDVQGSREAAPRSVEHGGGRREREQRTRDRKSVV